MSSKPTTVGIFGGAGVIGGELLRWLIQHPSLSLSFVHSRSKEGMRVDTVHPQLKGMCELVFSREAATSLSKNVDAVFVALRHGEAATLCSDLKDYHGTIVDLTGDHRLSDAALYPPIYGFEHPAPGVLKQFLYSPTELVKDALPGKKRISSPGCFATGAMLAAAPLVKTEPLTGTLFFGSVTGSSGAGATLSEKTHHPYRDENLFVYKPFKHQHEPEILGGLSSLSRTTPSVTLITHAGPFTRGIHTMMRTETARSLRGEEIVAIYRDFYRGSPFVRVLDEPPQLKRVIGSNFCDIYPVVRGHEVVVLSAIDNLVKGAAGQAIQSFNIATGRDEKEGLWTPPLFP